MSDHKDIHARLKSTIENADFNPDLRKYHSDRNKWAYAHADLGIARAQLILAQPADATREQIDLAIESLEKARTIIECHQDPACFAKVSLNLSIMLRLAAENEGMINGITLLQQALFVNTQLLRDLPAIYKKRYQLQLLTENGLLLRLRASYETHERASITLQQAIEALETASIQSRKAENFEEWAKINFIIGLCWQSLSQHLSSSTEIKNCAQKACQAFEVSIDYYQTRDETANLIRCQAELGQVLLVLATHQADSERQAILERAEKSLKACLQGLERDKDGEQFTKTHVNLAVCLAGLAQSYVLDHDKQDQAQLYLEEAILHYRIAMTIYRENNNMVLAALIEGNMGKDMSKFANLSSDRKAQSYRDQAITALKNSISAPLQQHYQQDWLLNSIELATCLQRKAQYEIEPQKTALYRQALLYYRKTLEVMSSDKYFAVRQRVHNWIGLIATYFVETATNQENAKKWLKRGLKAFELARPTDKHQGGDDYIALTDNLGLLYFHYAQKCPEEEALPVLLRALRLFDEALKFAERSHDETQLIRIKIHKAHCNWQILVVQDHNDDPKLRDQTLDLYTELTNKIDKDNYQQTLLFKTNIGLLHQQRFILNQPIGQTHRPDYDAALQTFQEIEALAQKHHMKRDQQQAQFYIANLKKLDEKLKQPTWSKIFKFLHQWKKFLFRA